MKRKGSPIRYSKEDLNRIKCWCKTLQPLSYPRLLAIAARSEYLGLPRSELLKLDKKALCTTLATHLHEKLPVSDDLYDFLKNASPGDIDDLMKLDTSTKECLFQPTEVERKTPRLDLHNLTDPVLQEPLTDFVRILPNDERLFNWDTVKQMRGGRHPLKNIPLPEGIEAKISTDTKTRDQWLNTLREEWGYQWPSIPVSTPPAELKFREGVAYIPLEPPEESPEVDLEHMLWPEVSTLEVTPTDPSETVWQIFVRSLPENTRRFPQLSLFGHLNPADVRWVSFSTEDNDEIKNISPNTPVSELEGGPILWVLHPAFGSWNV